MATTADRRQTQSGRFYDIDGHSYPSVTTILQIIAKPALLNWMAKTEREMVIEVSADLYETIHGTPKISRMGWVTTLQDRLGKAKAGHKELAKAGEIGTQAHELIEWNLHKMLGQKVGPEPKVQDKALWSFMSWQDWAKSVDLKPTLIEQVVYSEIYGYAGTMDLYGSVELAGVVAWFEKKQLPVPELLAALAKKQKQALVLADWKTGKGIYAESYLQNAAYRRALRDMGHGDADLGLVIRLPKVETDPEFEVRVCPPEKECFKVFLSFFDGWKWNQQMEEQYQEKKKAAKGTPDAKVAETLTASVEQTKTNGNGKHDPPAETGRGSMAAVPAEIPAPFDLGQGILESFEVKNHPKTKKPYGLLKQSGTTLYALTNTDLPIGGGELVPLFDILQLAIGKPCVFSASKKRVPAGYIFEVTGATLIGKHGWYLDGTPRIDGTMPPPTTYQATDSDVAF